MNDIITAQDAATRLACSIWHVYKLLDRGELREFRDGRRRKTFVSDVEAYIERKTSRGATPPEREPVQPAPTPRSAPPRSSARRLILRPPAKLKNALQKAGVVS